MKNILITSFNLDVGGIETSLVNLLNNFNKKQYKITLILQEKKGIFLSNISKNITIKEYKISKFKNVLFRKVFNRSKLILWLLKNKNKYDASICYATYDIPSSRLARHASKNNILWIHGNYFHAYNKNIYEIRNFFNLNKMEKFNKIIFVSNEAKDDLIKIYPNIKNKSFVINNLINDNIISLSKEIINERKVNKTQLLFVGRLEEKSKKISRLLNVIKLLKENNHDVGLWIIGDGKDKDLYNQKVKELDIKDRVKFFGEKRNPYPYFKKADAIILTSDYEGFPVVSVESAALNTPIISTINVSTDEIKLEEHGFICGKNEKDIYDKIESFINNQFKPREFNIKKYNSLLINKIENLIDGGF